LAFGDSFTQGLYATTEADAWRAVLWAGVAAAYPGSAVTTSYEGVSGGKTAAAYLEAQTDVLPVAPDLLTVQFGTNDVTGAGGTPATDDEFRTATAQLMDTLTGAAARLVVWLNCAWCNYADGGATYNRAVAFNAIIASEAERRGITVADVWTATALRDDFLSQPGEPSSFAPGFEGDDFHYNDAGHAAIAATVLAAVGVAVAARSRSSAAGRSAAEGRSFATDRLTL